MKNRGYIIAGISFLLLMTVLFVHSFGQKPGATTARAADPQAPSLAALLELLVYQDLVNNQSGEADKKNFGAYFLEAKQKEIPYFSCFFSNSAPRIEFGTNNLILSNSGAVDKLTKKPGKLFWARLQNVSSNFANVDAGSYVGPQGAESLTYQLKWNGTNWIIINRAMQTVY